MASTSSINGWIDQLVDSISPKSNTRGRQTARRKTENFRRRLRHHNYGRTNQFDVSDRLDGLEEKFQVLNRDDLSDALYTRRVELRDHFQQWIPDVLDLLLRLSDNPVHQAAITKLDHIDYAGDAPESVRWADIKADDPIDPHDPIWATPNFSDLSSNEDEVETPTLSISPFGTTHGGPGFSQSEDWQRQRIFDGDARYASNGPVACLQLPDTDEPLVVTETQLVRQSLVVAQALPSVLFGFEGKRLYLDHRVRTHGTSNTMLQALLKPLQIVQTNLTLIRDWTTQKHEQDYVQCIGQHMERLAQRVTVQICEIEESILRPQSIQTLTLTSVVDRVEEFGRTLAVPADWIRRISHADSVSALETLYGIICQYHFSGDSASTEILLPIFIDALFVYLEPIQEWITTGTLRPERSLFFTKTKDTDCPLSNIWHEEFEVCADGPHRAPSFLAHVVQDIFVCGKTVAFARQIARGAAVLSSPAQSSFDDTRRQLRSLASDPVAPFPVAFPVLLAQLVSTTLSTATLELKALLEARCGFSRTLDAFDLLYLHRDGVILDTIENRIFTRIDRCIDNWNDRYLIADTLEDIYQDIECISLDSLSVRSTHTSSRSMESRRRSVRILAALTIDYTIPWPVANIITSTAQTSYRRIALHLTQIRRVKHTLSRVAYPHVTSTVVGDNPADQLLAQTTTFMLTHFANTLYDHFTTGCILPATSTMRADLHAAPTVDAMIRVHADYIVALEFACLTAKQLKVLREALIALLDMCIRFTDILLSSSNDQARSAHHRNHHRTGSSDSDDFETSSFISARSHHTLGNRPGRNRRRGGRDTDTDDEDDESSDQGEGYSSFIVLDEDTTVAREIAKLRTQFRRQLDFLVAGLRGVARGGDGATPVEEFEILAGRLDWKERGR